MQKMALIVAILLGFALSYADVKKTPTPAKPTPAVTPKDKVKPDDTSKRVVIPEKTLAQMRLEERAFHITVAVEESCDDAFFDRFAEHLQKVSDAIWIISSGQFYIEKVSFIDNSWNGRFVIPKGTREFDLLSGKATGVGAQCRNPNTNGWFVLCPGRPRAEVIVVHEFFHGLGKLRDEGKCPCIMRGQTSGQLLPLCNKTTHPAGTKSCWDLLLERWPNIKDANPVFAAKSLPPKIQIAEKKHQKAPDGSREKILKVDGLTTNGIMMIERGRNKEALAFFNKALEIDPKSPAPLYNIACIYAMTGDKEKALDYLKRALDAGFDDFDLLTTDEDFKSLKEDKRFGEMIEKCRANLPGYRKSEANNTK